MAIRVDYTPIPYAARERYVADTSRLGQLIGLQSAAQGQRAGTQAEINQRKWALIAQAFDRFVQDRQQQQVAKTALTQRQAEQAAAEQLKRDEMRARAEERKEAERIRQEGITRQTQRDMVTDARALAGATVPGVVPSEMVEALQPSGRIQIQDGVPVLMRTPQQAQAAATEARLSKEKPVVPKSLQSKDVLYKGQPALATFDPSSGRYLVDGQEATADVRPIPPTKQPPTVRYQPREVLGDDGKPTIANYDALTGEHIDTKTGQPIKAPKPVPSAMEQMDSRKFAKSAPVLSAIAELSEKINTNRGVYAKLAGGASKLAAKINLDDDVAEYQALVSGFTPLVARSLGHTGVLTQQDVDSVRELFPKPGDSQSLRDRKVKRILGIVSQLEGTEGVRDVAPTTPARPARGANPFAKKP